MLHRLPRSWFLLGFSFNNPVTQVGMTKSASLSILRKHKVLRSPAAASFGRAWESHVRETPPSPVRQRMYVKQVGSVSPEQAAPFCSERTRSRSPVRHTDVEMRG